MNAALNGERGVVRLAWGICWVKLKESLKVSLMVLVLDYLEGEKLNCLKESLKVSLMVLVFDYLEGEKLKCLPRLGVVNSTIKGLFYSDTLSLVKDFK